MKTIANELATLIDQYLQALRTMPQTEMLHKMSPLKWSKKEIIGHMIDSAQNNIRRFIVAQYEHEPKIIYDQDKWVSLANYQEYDPEALTDLFGLLNKHIAVILKNMPEENAQRLCETGEFHSIEWLAKDYIKHLKHHVHQVLNLEPVAYP